MPELSRFYGIVVQTFVRDHAPPRFHVRYADQQAVVDIQRIAIVGGRLPPRAVGLVLEGSAPQQDEFLVNWDLATRAQQLRPIAPLA